MMIINAVVLLATTCCLHRRSDDAESARPAEINWKKLPRHISGSKRNKTFTVNCAGGLINETFSWHVFGDAAQALAAATAWAETLEANRKTYMVHSRSELLAMLGAEQHFSN